MSGKNERKKELLQQYKEKKVVGGLSKITNVVNGRYLLEIAVNSQSMKSRFEFSQKTSAFSSPLHPSMQQDWKQYGGESFTFEMLEELEKKEDQTGQEFKEELLLLKQLWEEKLDPTKAY